MSALDGPPDFLSRDACRALFTKLNGLTRGGGELTLSLVSRWRGSAEWGRNRIRVAADLRMTDLAITRSIRGSSSTVRTSRLDDDGLRDAVRILETNLGLDYEMPVQFQDPYVDQPILQPTLFSEPTYRMRVEDRTALVERMIAPAEAAGLQSAGELHVMADGNTTISSSGLFRYVPTTSVECAVTVRDRAGRGSGWAGVNHYDFAKIDPMALADRALSKARTSANPQAVEPGRYTTILEPQATADLFSMLVGSGQFERGSMGRVDAESGFTAFSGKQMGWTKISEQVLDPRLTMSADPMDPDGGFLPYERYSGTPIRPVSWIDRGILRELAYDQSYALSALGADRALPDSGSFRLAAAPGVPTLGVDDMIAKTERGVLVTRLSGVTQLDLKTVLCTGYTRDGLWLIERGKISRAIKNFRFTESPLFVLNRLLDVGPSVRVYKPGRAWVAPAVRVDDFSFTALADAV